MRHVVLVLGDQLSFTSSALEGFDSAQDSVLMIEAPGEATAVWSHKAHRNLPVGDAALHESGCRARLAD